jgi:drug/metabolite transporter (DMT)-like permease
MMLSANLRGIIAMCTAMALFVVNDAFVKLAAKSWPVHQIMVIRGVFAVCILGCVVILAREHNRLGVLKQPLVLARCLIEGFVAFTFISALSVLPIADVTAILLISPLLITVAGAFFFGEDVRWRRWMAVCVGFIGMLLVVRPGGETFNAATLLALASTAGVAVRDLLTRSLPASVPSLIVALGTSTATMVTGAVISAFQPWQAYDGKTLAYTAVAAITVAIGNYAIILAFRNVEVSVVSPFRYTVIIWAVIAGYIGFGDVPVLAAWGGIALIVGSGLYTLYREQITRLRDRNAVNLGEHEKSA